MNNNPKEWYIAYHGMRNVENSMSRIIEEGLIAGLN